MDIRSADAAVEVNDRLPGAARLTNFTSSNTSADESVASVVAAMRRPTKSSASSPILFEAADFWQGPTSS